MFYLTVAQTSRYLEKYIIYSKKRWLKYIINRIFRCTIQITGNARLSQGDKNPKN
jgi:hypothetical protein